MDLASAIKEIRAGGERLPKVETVDGKEYVFLPTTNGYSLERDPRPSPDPRAEVETLELSTLAGLVDFIEANIDGLDLDRHLVAVYGPLKVGLVSKLAPSHLGDRPLQMVRDVVVEAAAQPCGWKFGARVPQEEFVLGMLLNFVDSTERQELLNLVGNVRSEVVSSAIDDGVGQVVEGRVGVRLNAAIPVRNPWILAPYRTFREVPQVESACVLRVHRVEGTLPLFSLHEADGAGWSIDATARVAAWLREKLGDSIHVLA